VVSDYDIPVCQGQPAVLPGLVGVPSWSRWILGRVIGSKESAKERPERTGVVERAKRLPGDEFHTGAELRRPRRFQHPLADWLDAKANYRVNSGLGLVRRNASTRTWLA